MPRIRRQRIKIIFQLNKNILQPLFVGKRNIVKIRKNSVYRGFDIFGQHFGADKNPVPIRHIFRAKLIIEKHRGFGCPVPACGKGNRRKTSRQVSEFRRNGIPALRFCSHRGKRGRIERQVCIVLRRKRIDGNCDIHIGDTVCRLFMDDNGNLAEIFEAFGYRRFNRRQLLF